MIASDHGAWNGSLIGNIGVWLSVGRTTSSATRVAGSTEHPHERGADVTDLRPDPIRDRSTPTSVGRTGGLAAAYGLAVALAGLGPGGVLAVLVGAVAVAVTVLVAGLRPGLDPAPSEPGATVESYRAAAVLGISEVLGAAATSVPFAALVLAGDPMQTSRFYLLMIASAAFSVGWSYLLRLVQPRLVGRLERAGRAVAWRSVRRMSGWSAGIGGAATAALLVALLAAGWTGGGGWAPVVIAATLEMALYAAVTATVLVVENVDAHGRRWSATTATIQFGAVAGAGWWLVAGSQPRRGGGVRRPIRRRGRPDRAAAPGRWPGAGGRGRGHRSSPACSATRAARGRPTR